MKIVQSAPHTDVGEEIVVCAALVKPELVDEIANVLDEDDFYVPRLRTVWTAILRLHDNGQPIDIGTLQDELFGRNTLGVVGGPEGLGKLSDHWAQAHRWREHAQRIRALSAVRRLVAACTDVIQTADQSLVDPRAWLDEVGSRLESYALPAKGGKYRHIEHALGDEIRAIIERKAKRERGEHPCGIPTPWAGLDNCIYGWEPAKSYMIAARPGAGKTACALEIVRDASGRGFPCLMQQLEMADQEVGGRKLASESGVPRDKAKRGTVTELEMGSILAAAKRLQGMPIYIDDAPGLSIRDIRARARAWRRDPRISWGPGKLGILVVDYLQLASATNRHDSREQAVAEVARGLKALSKELQIPVIACAQLNRETEKRSGPPILADLRESGEIEQAADVIGFLWHPVHKLDGRGKPSKEVDKSIVELRIAKHRDGKTGAVRFNFDGARMRFTEIGA